MVPKMQLQVAYPSSLKALSISDNPQPSKCCTTSSSSPPQSTPTSKVPQPRTSQNPVSNELAAHPAPHRKTPPRFSVATLFIGLSRKMPTCIQLKQRKYVHSMC